MKYESSSTYDRDIAPPKRGEMNEVKRFAEIEGKTMTNETQRWLNNVENLIKIMDKLWASHAAPPYSPPCPLVCSICASTSHTQQDCLTVPQIFVNSLR